MRYKILFVLFGSVFISGIAQELPRSPIAAVIDSTLSSGTDQLPADALLRENPTSENTIFPKSFKDKFQSGYKTEDFNYTTVKPKVSLWQKLQRKIGELIQSVFGKLDPATSISYAGIAMRIIAVIIFAVIIYYLIRFLLGKEGNFFFSKKKSKTNIDNQDLQENIHEINFTENIDQYERQKDYRSAIRYQFLLVLKKLADQKSIIWNPEKTNKDYLKELKNPDLQKRYREVMHIFDYIWYGEFEVDEHQYQIYKRKFSDF